MNKRKFIKIIKDNGFSLVDVNSYANCLGINILIESNCITLANSNGNMLFLSNGDYYSVIGYLFCENLIHENFKIVKK